MLKFFCLHRKYTSPRADEEGEYIRCLSCAKRIPFVWGDSIELKPPIDHSKKSESKVVQFKVK